MRSRATITPSAVGRRRRWPEHVRSLDDMLGSAYPSPMPPTAPTALPSRPILTAAVWIASLTCLLVGALIALEFGLMATSLDPTEIVTAGTQPWSDALVATSAFAGLCVVTAVSLRLWHTMRFRAVALILTAAEIGCVAWACSKVYNEYF